ncbi:MAG TPA: 3-methyl-2-oxobutanoate hydroxymethyltransferase [Vicinamibacterales bacterium]|nr:3-methyl-2-oxobutanoate hydroxymethyltransferase [Vicinamibacterales bacterium]
MGERIKPVRAPDLKAKKRRGERITMLTAYDATMAGLLDRAGIDVLLVGDSLGMVVEGHDSTIPVTLDAMIHHTRAVSRGTKRALVVADMPFMTCQTGVDDAVRNAGRIVQQGGAGAVKIEGGRAVLDVAARLTDVGIPVMGHLGLTPQSVLRLGGYRPQARTPEDADELIAEAQTLEAAGVFALVLESIPAEVAATVTRELTIPTIGIGAGPYCDGQVLVSYDAFGMFDKFVPSFVKQYAHLAEEIVRATEEYISDVREGRFPAHEHTVGATTRRSGRD